MAAVAAAALPASAGAQASAYPPNPESIFFSTSAGGWTGSTDSTGLCIAPLTCPTITNSFVASGGTFGDGDGFLRTEASGLAEAAGTSQGIWTSPAFTYNGAAGQPPTDIVLSLASKSDLAALLSVASGLNGSIELVDVTAGGVASRLVNEAPISHTSTWTRVPLVVINPGQLVIGRDYQIRIITELDYTADVLPSGSVDYDDVIMIALRDGAGDGNGGGPGGGVGGIGGGVGVFDGRNLFLKLKCLGVKKNGKCRVRATALTSKKGKRLTFPIQRKVKKKGKVVRMRVRFQFRKRLERQRNVILRSKVTTGSLNDPDKKKIKFRKIRIIDRSP
ncbi:MAG: hypothetical protein ACRDK9_02180 [Solirubrobacterales bacterium]